MSAPLLPPDIWMARRRAHQARVAAWVEPRLARSSLGETHPIYDFLFEYYSYRPSHLRRWHPGLGTTLGGPNAEEFLAFPHYHRVEQGITVSTSTLKPERIGFARWLLALLEGIENRPPFYACAGLHEWAMVYQTPEVRHPKWPLRLGSEGTAAVVETLPVRCSHFDAFRFFTAPARPFNRLQPTRASGPTLEQSGCLHVNMDLYKWAYKLAPFTSSEVVADAFALAREIREIDMRASPYDFSALGFTPIRIETADGREEYEAHQRQVASRAGPIRQRLIAMTRALLADYGAAG